MKQSMILLADMHWGAINPERFYQELEDCLFKKIKKLTKENTMLDYIMILGDLFDTKEYLTSDVTWHVFKFLGELLHLTECCETRIVIITGTRTHDNNQPQTILKLASYLKHGDRIDVFDKVTEYDNMLFIPEEYIMNWEEYYKEYFNKKYDFIFGHGFIDKIWYGKDNNTTTKLSAPSFPVETLLSVGRHVYFGHIHTHKRYGENKQFMYVGPTTRWEFGKDEDCGFMYVEFDTETKEIFEEFIPNDLAPILTTRVLNIKEDIELNVLNDNIDTIIKEEMVYAERFRLIVNINTNIKFYNKIRDFIINKIGYYKFIKLIFNSNNISEESMDIMKETMEEHCVKRNYVFERNLDLENSIYQFIKERTGKIVTLDNIRKHLKSIEE